MKLKLITSLCLAMPLAAQGALVVIDNLDLPTPTTSGAQSNYQKQSFTPNVAGIGSNDTVAANSPLPTSVFLQSATFLTTPTGSGTTAGNLFVDVYLGVGNGGTFIGSSSNSVDVIALGFNAQATWNFDNLSLDSSQEYALVFSTDSGAGNPATARLTAANNGGGFVNTYSGGTADDSASGASPVPFDARFNVIYDTIPEPGSTALIGLAGLGLLMRRRA